MEKEFVPYSEALALKELGFDEPCMGYRDGGGYLMIKETPHCVISAPTFSQAFRWFRENYDLTVSINRNRKFKPVKRYEVIIDESTYEKINVYGLDYYDSYEEAELECLKKLIKIVKNS
jgi:hypothetical protein